MSNSTVLTWGDLESTERFGRESGLEKYELIDKSNPKYEKSVHAAHCMVYAKTTDKFSSLYEMRAVVLMQMRFDGYLGFPGGLVDAGESPVVGLNRELAEEINWRTRNKVGPVLEEHHQFTHHNKDTDLVLHFYAVEVDEKKIKQIEKNCVDAVDHGIEGMGLVRVPLYTMGDGYRGFPCFLHNNFIGNAKFQLLETLKQLNILPEWYINEALKATPVRTS